MTAHLPGDRVRVRFGDHIVEATVTYRWTHGYHIQIEHEDFDEPLEGMCFFHNIEALPLNPGDHVHASIVDGPTYDGVITAVSGTGYYVRSTCDDLYGTRFHRPEQVEVAA